MTTRMGPGRFYQETGQRTVMGPGGFVQETVLTGLEFSAVVESASTISGDVFLFDGLSGQVDSSTVISGGLGVTRPFASQVDSLSSVSGSISATRPLDASVVSQSEILSDVGRLIAFDAGGDPGSLSEISGEPEVLRGLATVVDSASVIQGLFNTAAPAEVPFTGIILSASTISAGLSVARSIDAAIQSATTISGATSTAAGLSSQVDSQTALSGRLGIDKALASAIVSTSFIQGFIDAAGLGQIKFASRLDSVSDLSGAIDRLALVNGSLISVTDISGTMARARGFSATMVAQSIIQGDISELIAAGLYINTVRARPDCPPIPARDSINEAEL